jgi:hypothetical protein
MLPRGGGGSRRDLVRDPNANTTGPKSVDLGPHLAAGHLETADMVIRANASERIGVRRRSGRA